MPPDITTDETTEHPTQHPVNPQSPLFDPIGGTIPRAEPVMLLRASDPLAAALVRLWADRQEDEHLSATARRLAEMMESYAGERRERNTRAFRE